MLDILCKKRYNINEIGENTTSMEIFDITECTALEMPMLCWFGKVFPLKTPRILHLGEKARVACVWTFLSFVLCYVKFSSFAFLCIGSSQ